jgi:ER membrane protein complex subunit 7
VKISVHEGEVHAIVPEFANKPAIAYPLRIAPLTQMQYFEQKKPFSLWAWLKTPYGLMIGFMVFSLVVMPMLKVDPEEYAQMLEEKKKLTESFTGRGGNGNASRKERR